MTTRAGRPEWTAELETEIFERVAARYAPHVPPAGSIKPREPRTPDEIEGAAEYLTRVAAHDSFIVQVVAKGIDRLFPEIPFQQRLARQAGDDASHAITARARVLDYTGRDPIERIKELVQGHWTALEDLPYRDWFGFFAFELHYELHIQARLKIEGRTGRIRPKAWAETKQEAGQEANDELIHRIYVIDWLEDKFAAASASERSEWAERLIAADDEFQRRLNPYLRTRVVTGERAWGADTRNSVEIYDGWRKEILSHVVQQPIDRLPALTSLAA